MEESIDGSNNCVETGESLMGKEALETTVSTVTAASTSMSLTGLLFFHPGLLIALLDVL